MQCSGPSFAALPALRVQVATVEALVRDVARLRHSATHVASEAALPRDDIAASLAASGVATDTWTVLDADDPSANWTVAFKQVPTDTLFAWLQRAPLTLRASAQTATLQERIRTRHQTFGFDTELQGPFNTDGHRHVAG